MSVITLKTGEQLEFDPLVYNKNHLIKLNLNQNGSSSGEGIWAVVKANDFNKYDSDKKTGYFVAMLANDALEFYPNRSWGIHVVGEWRGTNRPVANLNWVDYDDKRNRVWSTETPKEYQY